MTREISWKSVAYPWILAQFRFQVPLSREENIIMVPRIVNGTVSLGKGHLEQISNYWQLIWVRKIIL